MFILHPIPCLALLDASFPSRFLFELMPIRNFGKSDWPWRKRGALRFGDMHPKSCDESEFAVPGGSLFDSSQEMSRWSYVVFCDSQVFGGVVESSHVLPAENGSLSPDPRSRFSTGVVLLM